MLDYIIERCEGRRQGSRDVMTNVRTYYSRAIPTDNGYARVAYAVLRLGETYNGRIASALLEARDEVLVDLSKLQPNTIMHIVRKCANYTSTD